MGKPQSEIKKKEKAQKAPISRTWVCECHPTGAEVDAGAMTGD